MRPLALEATVKTITRQWGIEAIRGESRRREAERSSSVLFCDSLAWRLWQSGGAKVTAGHGRAQDDEDLRTAGVWLGCWGLHLRCT